MHDEAEEQIKTCCARLIDELNRLVTLHRHLLACVREENDILIAADLDRLAESNQNKEKLVLEIREKERSRLKHSLRLAELLDLDLEQPSLEEIIVGLPEDQQRERLHSLKNVLLLLFRRIREINRNNEELVNTGLKAVRGSLSAIQEFLVESSKNYGNKKQKTTASGHLVSREV